MAAPSQFPRVQSRRLWRFDVFVGLLFVVLVMNGSALAQGSRWRQLNTKVRALYSEGKYWDAIPIAKQSLEVAEKTFGADSIQVSTSLANLGTLYTEQANYRQAEASFKRALAICDKRRPDSIDVAIALEGLAGVYRQQNRNAEAKPLCERALAIRQKLGSDDAGVADSLDDLGLVYQELGQYADAEPLHERALAIRERLGPEDLQVALSLNNIGALRTEEGEYGEAETFFKRALAIRDKKLPADHPDVATSLDNLAVVYDDQSLYDEAEPLYKRSLAIRESRFGGDHPEVAFSLNNLALVYKEEGRYSDAEPLYKRAIAIREQRLGPDHLALAASLDNLGNLFVDEGRYGDAEPLFKRSLAIHENKLGKNHPDVATPLNNLAGMYRDEGQDTEAELLYKRALAIRENRLAPTHPDLAISLNNLAGLYEQQGRYAAAEDMYKKVLAIWEGNPNPNRERISKAINNLGLIYQDEGRYDEAESSFNRALAMTQARLGSDSQESATPLDNLAVLFKTQARYAEAEPLYKRALEILENRSVPDDSRTGTVLTNLALCYYAWQRPHDAELFFNRALANRESQFERQFPHMSEKERLAFVASANALIPAYLSFGMQYRDQIPEVIGNMYNVVLWAKGLVAGSVATDRARLAASVSPELKSLFDELTAKRSEWASLSNVSPKDSAKWKDKLAELENESASLEKQFALQTAAIAGPDPVRPTWQDIRAALAPSDAAVEYARFRLHDGKQWTNKSFYCAFVIRPQSTMPGAVLMPKEASDLEGPTLANYKAWVGGPGQAIDRSGAGLDFTDAFWEPVETLLAGVSRVFIATDGILDTIAFGSLPRRTGELLLQGRDLRLVLSTKDLLRHADPSKEKSAVLLGNPNFALTAAQERTLLQSLHQQGRKEASSSGHKYKPRFPTSKSSKSDSQNIPVDQDCSSNQSGVALCPLGETQEEVDAIGDELRRHQWQVNGPYTRSWALKAVIQTVKHPTLLHLATHGFFPDDVASPDKRPDAVALDPMLRSGLYFAGADRTLKKRTPVNQPSNGVLTAAEASTLDLHGTELVVLSACGTGLGNVQSGEGVFGLRRGLQEAGAEGVLMSMWSVPENETKELMLSFYEKWLSGEDKHQAFKEAELDERKTVILRWGRDRPDLWAGFVLVGPW